MQTASIPVPRARTSGVPASLALVAACGPAHAAEFFVRNSSASCSNTRPGTAAAPCGSVTAAHDSADPALWSRSSGDVWVAASVITAPVQVFADDARPAPSTAAPSALPQRSFTFVSGSGRFVDAGGGDPGTHRTQVGARTNSLARGGGPN